MELKEMAEGKYPPERDGFGNGYPRDKEIQAYIDGIEEGFKFFEWVAQNGYTRSDFAWYNAYDEMVCLNTEKLFHIYLNEGL